MLLAKIVFSDIIYNQVYEEILNPSTLASHRKIMHPREKNEAFHRYFFMLHILNIYIFFLYLPFSLTKI